MPEAISAQTEPLSVPKTTRLVLLNRLVTDVLSPNILDQTRLPAQQPEVQHDLSKLGERTAKVVAQDRKDISMAEIGTADSPGKFVESLSKFKEDLKVEPQDLSEYAEFKSHAPLAFKIKKRARALSEAEGLLAAHRGRLERTKALAKRLPDDSELKAHVQGIAAELEKIDAKKPEPEERGVFRDLSWSEAETELRELEADQLKDLTALTVDLFSEEMLVSQQDKLALWDLKDDDDSVVATSLRASLSIPQTDVQLQIATQFNEILDRVKDRYKVVDRKLYLDLPTIPITPEEIAKAKSHIVDKYISEYDDHIRGMRPKHRPKELSYNSAALQAFSDLSLNFYLRTLFQGGRESWEGTTAATWIGHLRDPRAIPALINYFREAGSGHTSAAAASIFPEIIKNPLSQDVMDEVVASLPRADQMMIAIIKDPDSFFEEYTFDNYVRVSSFGDSLTTVTKELIAKHAQEMHSASLEKDEFRRFMGGWTDSKIIPTVLENPEAIGRVIIESQLPNWRRAQPEIMHVLTNPENGKYEEFSKQILTEGLGLTDQALVDKLETLYQTKDLARGVAARDIVVDGLLLLATKGQAGQDAAHLILSVAEPTQADAVRFRKILGLLNQLELMDSFTFIPGASLQEVYGSIRSKTASVAIEKLQINPSLHEAMEQNLDSLLASGMLEIAPHLVASYEAKGAQQARDVLRESVEHIVLGDFHEWRSTHSASRQQLEFLPETNQSYWTEPASDTVVVVKDIEGGTQKSNLIISIRRIVSEAQSHLAELADFDTSIETLEQMRADQQLLISGLKSGSTSPEIKSDLGRKKSLLDSQIKLLGGIIDIAGDAVDSTNLSEIQRRLGEMRRAAQVLGFDQVASDLTEAERALSEEESPTKTSEFRATDTDDPVSLLKSGTEPRETCQSWRGGMYNECLPATLADADKRLINVVGEQNEIVGRALIKGRQYRTFDDYDSEMKPVILIEPVYTLRDQPEIHEAILKHAIKKADTIGAEVVLSADKSLLAQTGASNDETTRVLQELIKDMGYEITQMSISISVPRSYNDYEYTDSLGGKIATGQPQSLSAIVIRRKSH